MNKLDLQRILDAQQEKFELMLARVLKKQAGSGPEEIETSIYCKLSSLISEFSVDIPRDITLSCRPRQFCCDSKYTTEYLSRRKYNEDVDWGR